MSIYGSDEIRRGLAQAFGSVLALTTLRRHGLVDAVPDPIRNGRWHFRYRAKTRRWRLIRKIIYVRIEPGWPGRLGLETKPGVPNITSGKVRELIFRATAVGRRVGAQWYLKAAEGAR